MYRVRGSRRGGRCKICCACEGGCCKSPGEPSAALGRRFRARGSHPPRRPHRRAVAASDCDGRRQPSQTTALRCCAAGVSSLAPRRLLPYNAQRSLALVARAGCRVAILPASSPPAPGPWPLSLDCAIARLRDLRDCTPRFFPHVGAILINDSPNKYNSSMVKMVSPTPNNRHTAADLA